MVIGRAPWRAALRVVALAPLLVGPFALAAPPAPTAAFPAPALPASSSAPLPSPAPPPAQAATPVVPAPVVLADSPPEASAKAATRLHHAALAVAKPHQPLVIHALLESPHLVKRTLLVYRIIPAYAAPAAVEWKELEFQRATSGPYTATVPATDVRAPGLDYLVEFELADGHREPAFASRLVPQRVSIYEEPMDVRERVALERLGGRRSLTAASFEYARFSNASGAAADWYYRTEAAYTYRVLRTVDEFSIHVGVVRGRSPAHDELVGLNYASASLKLRIADVFRIEGELLSSVTEVGFAAGGGGALDIGDPFGAKLRLGFEAVHDFGARFYSQVDVPIIDHLRLSPIVEATNMPHAGRYGVRLLGEVAYDFGNGFGAALRGGYEARTSTDGAPSAGAQLMYAF
jgi:hypothetical protein